MDALSLEMFQVRLGGSERQALVEDVHDSGIGLR